MFHSRELGGIESALRSDDHSPFQSDSTCARPSLGNFRARGAERSGGDTAAGHDHAPGTEAKSARPATGAISGSRARRGLRGGLARGRAQPLHAPFGLRRVPTHDAAPRSDRHDARDAELGAPRDDRVERAGLGERDRERDARDQLGLLEARHAREPAVHAAERRLDHVPAPGPAPSATVTCSPAEAAHPLEVVSVGAGDLDGVVERIGERVRRRVSARPPRRGPPGPVTTGRPTGCARRAPRSAA